MQCVDLGGRRIIKKAEEDGCWCDVFFGGRARQGSRGFFKQKTAYEM